MSDTNGVYTNRLLECHSGLRTVELEATNWNYRVFESDARAANHDEVLMGLLFSKAKEETHFTKSLLYTKNFILR